MPLIVAAEIYRRFRNKRKLRYAADRRVIIDAAPILALCAFLRIAKPVRAATAFAVKL
jgi:hypothetical protein